MSKRKRFSIFLNVEEADCFAEHLDTAVVSTDEDVDNSRSLINRDVCARFYKILKRQLDKIQATPPVAETETRHTIKIPS